MPEQKFHQCNRLLGNHVLFVQFLKDYVPLELWNGLSPDDIEDVSERFLPLLQNSRDSDTVKRVNLKGGPPFFVVALVEHQSKVDFNTPFRLLRYITLVLTEYEREANRDHPGFSSTKNFRFPPVLPVVFYDGRSPWTAAGNGIENPGKFNYIDGGCDNGTIEPPRVCCASRIKPPKIHFCEFLYDFALKRNKLLVIPEDQIRAAANLISEKGVDRMFDQFVEGYFESKGLAREEERERAYRISWKLPGSSK